MTGLVYRSALGYELVMRVLYGRHYAGRLRAVAEQVPADAPVLELCPGPGALYARHLDRMVAAARRRVIVAEPIRNLAGSAVPMLAALSRLTTDAGAGGHEQRFDEISLDDLMARYADVTIAAFTIDGGREKVFVLAPR